jgi:hypothetical protein
VAVDAQAGPRHGREPTGYDAQPDPTAVAVLWSGEHQFGDSVQGSPGYGQRTFVHCCSLLV